MSYCRMAEDSDVYCYSDMSGGYTTHAPNGSFNDKTLEGFKGRLLALREQGFKVPNRALERVERELIQACRDVAGRMP
jgi:hypothetical protein